MKLIIPAKLKPPFLIQLRSMNVTGRSLFPGPDGFGRSLREATRLHAFKSAEEAQFLSELRVAVAEPTAAEDESRAI
ncbi:MAG: hypothetical protein ACR2M1_04475 [Gemmatimonadaceae bacterium]